MAATKERARAGATSHSYTPPAQITCKLQRGSDHRKRNAHVSGSQPGNNNNSTLRPRCRRQGKTAGYDGLQLGPGAGRAGARAGGHPLHAASAAGDLLQHPAHALRRRQEAGEDQAPQVRQGAAVRLQVRRHLHPRRRGPSQRQEVTYPIQTNASCTLSAPACEFTFSCSFSWLTGPEDPLWCSRNSSAVGSTGNCTSTMAPVLSISIQQDGLRFTGNR